jgi:hypothetical protein
MTSMPGSRTVGPAQSANRRYAATGEVGWSRTTADPEVSGDHRRHCGVYRCRSCGGSLPTSVPAFCPGIAGSRRRGCGGRMYRISKSPVPQVNSTVCWLASGWPVDCMRAAGSPALSVSPQLIYEMKWDGRRSSTARCSSGTRNTAAPASPSRSAAAAIPARRTRPHHRSPRRHGNRRTVRQIPTPRHPPPAPRRPAPGDIALVQPDTAIVCRPAGPAPYRADCPSGSE